MHSLSLPPFPSLLPSPSLLSTNIPDERRTVISISVSPIGDLSVCVDEFGRVLLLDNRAMAIRKMWKGTILKYWLFCVLHCKSLKIVPVLYLVYRLS